MSAHIADLAAVSEALERLHNLAQEHLALVREIRDDIAKCAWVATLDGANTIPMATNLRTIREVWDSVDDATRKHPELSRYGHDEESTEAWLDALHEIDNADRYKHTNKETDDDGTNDVTS